MDRLVYEDANSAINKLRNNGVIVNVERKMIEFSDKRPVGIKLWGAIDYLMHHTKQGWDWQKVR